MNDRSFEIVQHERFIVQDRSNGWRCVDCPTVIDFLATDRKTLRVRFQGCGSVGPGLATLRFNCEVKKEGSAPRGQPAQALHWLPPRRRSHGPPSGPIQFAAASRLIGYAATVASLWFVPLGNVPLKAHCRGLGQRLYGLWSRQFLPTIAISIYLKSFLYNFVGSKAHP